MFRHWHTCQGQGMCYSGRVGRRLLMYDRKCAGTCVGKRLLWPWPTFHGHGQYLSKVVNSMWLK